MPSQEKPAKENLSRQHVSLAVLRVGQWASALTAFVSFFLLFNYIGRHKLGTSARMGGVVKMSLVALAYSTLVICTAHAVKRLRRPFWHKLAKLSVAGDLVMIALSIAEITVLSIAGLPANCYGLTRENYLDNDLKRQAGEGYSTIRFGPGTRNNVGELDRFCHLPRMVYSLCVISIFSYTLSILLTALQLQRCQLSKPADENSLPAGHVEAVVPDLTPQPAQPPSPRHSAVATDWIDTTGQPPNEFIPLSPITSLDSSPDAPPSSSTTSTPTPPVSDVFGRPSTHSERSDSISWRTSQDTATSIFDPEHYLVSDGFRPPAQPPTYSSRPPSLYAVK